MFERLLFGFFRLTLSDRVLFLLVLSVLITLALAITFAAVTIVLRVRNTRKALRWAKLESAWQPLLLAILAGDQPAEALTGQIGPTDRLFFLDYLSHHAGRVTGADLARLRELAAPFLPLLEKRIDAPEYEQRARALHTFGLFAADRYVADFIRLLDDSSPLVAITAARALAATRNLDHAPALFARIARFETWSPKFLATLFTGMGSGVAPLLREKFADPAIPGLARLVAAESLLELHDIQCADTAAVLLAGSEATVNLRAAALRLIAAVGLPRHLPVVRAELGAANPIIRAHAATALGTLAEPGDLDRLAACLADESIWVAFQAAGALAQAGGLARVTALAASTTDPRAELARQFLTERH